MSDNCPYTEEDVKRLIEGAKKQGRKILFLGALGAGMSPLSRAMLSDGYSVIGVDRAGDDPNLCFPYPVYTEIKEAELDSVVLAVRSLAISEDDPTVRMLRRRGIPLIDRPRMLDIYSESFGIRVGVAGTHGKSTVTAMLAHILIGAGVPFTVIGGAEVAKGDSLYKCGRDIILFEACEYRDAFLKMHPDLAVITRVELDHTDYFESFDQYLDSFRRFSKSASARVVGTDFEGYEHLLAQEGKSISFGKGEGAQIRYRCEGKRQGRYEYSLYYDNKCLHSFLPLLGEYNLANAAAAIAAAGEVGIAPPISAKILQSFRGIGRRMQRLEDYQGKTVYYDYAHHPTEIREAIGALADCPRPLTVVFRPHTYTRTKSFMREFAAALSLADRVLLLEVFAARERAIEGVSSSALADLIGNRAISMDFPDTLPYLQDKTQGTVLLLGAGDLSPMLKKMYGE